MTYDKTSQDRSPLVDVRHRRSEPDLQHDEHRIVQMMAVWRYTAENARYELDTRPHRPWRGYAFIGLSEDTQAKATVGQRVASDAAVDGVRAC